MLGKLALTDEDCEMQLRAPEVSGPWVKIFFVKKIQIRFNLRRLIVDKSKTSLSLGVCYLCEDPFQF